MRRYREFAAQRNSFYVESINANGWPYIQHRGGPRGFVKVIGPARLAFADYAGNRQYLTAGNLIDDARVRIAELEAQLRRADVLTGNP